MDLAIILIVATIIVVMFVGSLTTVHFLTQKRIRNDWDRLKELENE